VNKWNYELFKSQGGLHPMHDGKPDDLFLVCGSYEERTLAVTQALATSYRSRRAIIYVNRELRETSESNQVESNLQKLYDELQHHSDQVARIEGSWQDPRAQLIALRDALIPVATDDPNQAWSITIDCTTFSRECLLTAMALLRARFPNSNIRVAYVSPVKYGEWLSRGYRTVRNVMTFAGIQQSSRPTLLLVLAGFESERTLRLIEEHEPNKVLLGIGDPPTHEQFLQQNLNYQKLILSRQEVQEFRLPVGDIWTCRRQLDELVSPYLKTHNVVIAPMNTKISTLAVYLIAERYPEIQVSYCVPGEYNTKDYSAGVDNIFIGDIPNVDSKAEVA
jgi:hypothetical protein